MVANLRTDNIEVHAFQDIDVAPVSLLPPLPPRKPSLRRPDLPPEYRVAAIGRKQWTHQAKLHTGIIQVTVIHNVNGVQHSRGPGNDVLILMANGLRGAEVIVVTHRVVRGGYLEITGAVASPAHAPLVAAVGGQAVRPPALINPVLSHQLRLRPGYLRVCKLSNIGLLHRTVQSEIHRRQKPIRIQLTGQVMHGVVSGGEPALLVHVFGRVSFPSEHPNVIRRDCRIGTQRVQAASVKVVEPRRTPLAHFVVPSDVQVHVTLFGNAYLCRPAPVHTPAQAICPREFASRMEKTPSTVR